MMKLEKQRLRDALQERMRKFSREVRAACAEALVRQLESEVEWVSRSRIFGFAPLPSEPNYLPAVVSGKKELFLPRCAGRELVFARVREEELEGLLFPGRRGMWEPPGGDPSVEPVEPIEPGEGDLILVPGVGFRTDGSRLGRGGGFYDRYLALHPEVLSWGLCFPWQLIDAMPVEPHDAKVRRVIVAGTAGCPDL